MWAKIFGGKKPETGKTKEKMEEVELKKTKGFEIFYAPVYHSNMEKMVKFNPESMDKLLNNLLEGINFGGTLLYKTTKDIYVSEFHSKISPNFGYAEIHLNSEQFAKKEDKEYPDKTEGEPETYSTYTLTQGVKITQENIASIQASNSDQILKILEGHYVSAPGLTHR